MMTRARRLSIGVSGLLFAASSASAFVQHQRQPALLCSRHRRPATRLIQASTAAASSPSSNVAGENNSRSKPTIERLPNSAVEITLHVPGTATQAAYDKVVRDVAKNVNLPGFRKGSKIPPALLEHNLAKNGERNVMKKQAITELVNQLVEPTLKAEALDPVGQPTLVVPADELASAFVAGETLTLKIKCDVWPDIKWKSVEGQDKPYIGLTGSYRRKPFNQERLDAALRDLRERYAALSPITDLSHKLAMGDVCVVNMDGYHVDESSGGKGAPLPNAASGDGVEMVLAPDRYMPGLVEGLVGAKVGETRTVQVRFPEKLRDKTLAGKSAIFDVQILEASQRTVPEVTDAFAAQVRDGLTAATLLAELRKAIDQEDAPAFAPARNQALSAALARVTDVDVPDTLVTNQARDKFALMMAEMRDNGVADDEIKRQINPENFNKYKDIVRDDIVRDFKASMATDEIARLENIDVPAHEVEEQLAAVKKEAAAAAQSEAMDENMLRSRVEATLQRQAVMDWLAERADLDVQYEDETFDEALLQKLADETLEREKAMATTNAAAAATGTVAEPATTMPTPPAPTTAATAFQNNNANMTLQDKAFQALVDAGAVVNTTPDDPDSADDQVAS